MNELIAQFHIDWRLLVAQLVNFVIVLIALNYLIWKPLRRMMYERTTEIETGLKTAESAKQIIIDAQAESDQFIHAAQVQSSEIRTQATIDGQRITETLQAEGKQQAEKIITRAQDTATGIVDTATKNAAGVAPELAVHIARQLLSRELAAPESSREFAEKLAKNTRI